MSLADELKRLGITLPSEHIADVDGLSAADIIHDVMNSCVWSHKEFPVDEGFEAFLMLDQQATQLAHTLARRGIRAISTQDHHAPARHTSTTINGVTVRGPCEHPRVSATQQADRLWCRDCNMPVNPVWWIARHASTLQRSEEWLSHLRREKRELEAEIETLKKERANHKAALRRSKKP